jgi:hypothetical protein
MKDLSFFIFHIPLTTYPDNKICTGTKKISENTHQ